MLFLSDKTGILNFRKIVIVSLKLDAILNAFYKFYNNTIESIFNL